MATQTITQTEAPKAGYESFAVKQQGPNGTENANRQPLQRNHSLDKWSSSKVTPTAGTEFGKEVQLSELLKAKNADELVKDLAILSRLTCCSSASSIIRPREV